ncbi:MAG: Glu/Leu/Phe/Val dehydrogenase [Candidatus Berkelbacteria bacterium]
MKDVFDGVTGRLAHIKQRIGLSDSEVKALLEPERISRATLKIGSDNLPAWRVAFNTNLGPAKGGIRFHPEVSEGEVKSLAFWMALKNSLVGLPYGGGKGGVKFNPKGKSKDYIDKVSRAYVDAFYKHLGENIDIPAPDVYTNPEIMGVMLDQFEKKIGQHQPAMITGKPLELGGLALRSDSTAKGGFIVIKELLHHIEGISAQPSVAIQGFGNAGLNIAKMLFADGFKIVAVSDSSGGIYDKSGIDINKAIDLKKSGTSAIDFVGAKITNEELLELPVDILVLAALENQITAGNADKIKAKNIIELANGPVDFAADEILWKKKILVVPDILANSGGVIVSYFEWAQNKTGNILEPDFLEKKLFDMMEAAWHRVYELFKDRNDLDLRTAAYSIAIDRILRATSARGRMK